MKIYPFPNKMGWKILVSAALLALLALSRDCFYSGFLGFTKSQFLSMGILVVMGVVFLAINRHSWKAVLTDRRILIAGVSAVLLLLPMLIKQDWQLMYLSVLAYILGCILVSYFMPLEELSKFLVVAMTIAGGFSVLANYILRIPADLGWIKLPIFYNSMDVDFYFMGLSFVSIDYLPMRNFGIFREPGVYQFFLLVAVYLTFYHVSWKKERNMWFCAGILSAVVISTFATGGIIELGLLAVVVFFDKQYYKRKRILVLAVAAVLAVIAAVSYSLITQSFLNRILSDIFAKLFVDNPSRSDRIDSILGNLQFALCSPLAGAPLGEVLHGVDHNTSSSTILFAMLGIPGGLYHVAGWAALVWQKRERWLSQLLLLAILAMSFNTCNIMWNIWFWMLPTVALCQFPLKKFQ